MTPETAAWLLQLLNNVTLSVGAEDFEEQSQAAAKARSELKGILEHG